MFQFRRFPTRAYLIQRALTGSSPAGLPHSEIHGSQPICGSPWLIAACHVLLRLLMPRHPPCALVRLTSSSRKWRYSARGFRFRVRLTPHSLTSLLLYLANPLTLGFARFFTRSCFATIFRQLQSSCPRIMQAPLTEVLVREIADYPFYKDLPHCFANFFVASLFPSYFSICSVFKVQWKDVPSELNSARVKLREV